MNSNFKNIKAQSLKKLKLQNQDEEISVNGRGLHGFAYGPSTKTAGYITLQRYA